jgi:DNA-binding GntR family transcriptional regulator
MYHHRFHDIYLEGSNNKQLIDMLKTLRMQNIWYCREVKDNLELEYSLYKELFHHLKKKDIEENEIVAFMEKEIIGLGIKNFHEYLKNKA